MSYMKARSSRTSKPPANPIVTGCLGTIYLAFLFVVAYGILTLLTQQVPEAAPEVLRDILQIPPVVGAEVVGQYIELPIPTELVYFVELALIVMVLLAISSIFYSLFYQSSREKEGWELYAEEAERQARMAKARERK